MGWTRLHLQVRTPLFGGDDTTGAGQPVRVPAVRGVLRAWLRAVAAGRGVTGRDELWRTEQEVFGSTSTPSRIALRVPVQPKDERITHPVWATTGPEREFDGAQYLLGQGLWRHGAGLRRPFVEPGTAVALDVRFSGDPRIDARFMLALWAWLTFGGLGARTRRGFGQLVCTGVDGPLPPNWSIDHLVPQPTVECWQELGNDPFAFAPPDSALDWPEPLTPSDDPGPMPAVPSLAPRWWSGAVFGQDGDLGRILHLAGTQWRWYRAGRSPAGDAGVPPSADTRSPEWTKVIHGQHDEYPVAALGLPVGYYSTSGERPFTAVVTPHAADGTQLRRASPVWIRPVQVEQGWAVFTHVFFSRLLPPGATLRVTGGRNRTLDPPSADLVDDQWNRWLDGDPRREP